MNDWHLFTFYFQIYNVNCVAATKAGSASAAKQARERVLQSHGFLKEHQETNKENVAKN